MVLISIGDSIGNMHAIRNSDRSVNSIQACVKCHDGTNFVIALLVLLTTVSLSSKSLFLREGNVNCAVDSSASL